MLGFKTRVRESPVGLNALHIVGHQKKKKKFIVLILYGTKSDVATTINMINLL